MADPDYSLYCVSPLEGQWGLQEKIFEWASDVKEHFSYQLMIKQPDFVTPQVAAEALVRAKTKIPEDLAESARFKTIEEGLVAQILHWFLRR